MELRECDLCSELAPNVWFRIHTYNGVLICNHCTEFGLFSKKPVVVLNHIKCCVCLETKKGIELPSCEHMLCISCCKRIYYGYVANSSMVYPIRFQKRLELPAFPYDDSYMEYEWTLWENYEYRNSLKSILKERDRLKPSRPNWMNTPRFLEYEVQFIKYWIEQFQLDDEDEKWIAYREKQTRNVRCPLCRRV